MATVLGQFREPGVCKQVTEITVDTDGQWLRATTLDQLDELMNDAAFYAYITSSTGSVLEVAADGLRLSSQALDAGLGGGGADKVRLDMGSLSPATNPAGSDQFWLERAGGQYRITYTEFLSNIPSASTNLTVTEAPANVAIDSSSGTGDTIALAGAVNSGVMSPAHYTKLEGIEDLANAYVHPNHTGGDCDSVGDGAITINTGAVVEAKLADSAVTAVKLDTDAVTTVKIVDANITEPKLASNAVSTVKIQDNAVVTAKIPDANVTLAKLAPDARTDLSVINNATNLEIDNTTGTNALIPLADSVPGNVGLVEDFDKRKLDDTIYVTDYPQVDPTGQADSQLGVQAAINDAIAKDVRVVKFPKGVYLFSNPVELPFDSSGGGKRLTLDFCNSRIQVSTDITMFRRHVTSISPESQTQNWMLTLKNARCVALGNNIGQAFDIWQCSNVRIENMRCVNLRTFCRLVFCLHHVVINVNCSDVDFPYIIRGGEGIIPGATYNDSSSNNGTWIAVRCQLTDLAAIGFDSSNSGNLTYINCTCEGSAAQTAWRHAGKQVGQELARLNMTMINCWLEFNLGDLTNAVVLEDLIQSVVEINLFGVQQPDSVVYTKLVGETKRSTIRWKDTELFQANTGSVGPFFDADIKAAINEQNRWEFINCTVQGATETLSDPSRWQSGSNGTVPTVLYESTWQYNGATIYDTNLSIPGSSLLLNEGTTTAKAKGQQVNLLPQASPVGGSWLFGENDSGELAKFNPADITATSRKDSVEDEGTMTSPQTIDWDSGLYDNKLYLVTSDVVNVVMTATRLGEYQLWLKNDGTGYHLISFTTTGLEPSTIRVGLDPRANALTVLRLYFDGTLWHWG